MRNAVFARARHLYAIAIVCVAVIWVGTDTGIAKDDAAYAKHVAAANAAAGEDLKYLTHLCGDDQGGFLNSLPAPPSPFKIFDNLYIITAGTYVSSIVITTSAGIILIDALNNSADAANHIIGGLKTLGLDPNSIKYVIASHGHSDHFGGMQEIKKQIPGTRLAMTAQDWEYAGLRPDVRVERGKPPTTRDMTIRDGQKLTLGDTTITMYVTPGHTPGTLSFIIPAKYQGATHMMSMFGGTSMPAEPHSLAEFKISLDRFSEIEKAAKVEGRLSTHPGWTDANAKMLKMKANPKGPNLFLETKDYMARYEKVRDECRQAMIARIP